MPLTSLQFELALDEEMSRLVRSIHEFLAASRHLAFTPAEVADAVSEREANVLAVLEKLDDLDLVYSGRFDGELYFLYREDLPPLR